MKDFIEILELNKGNVDTSANVDPSIPMNSIVNIATELHELVRLGLNSDAIDKMLYSLVDSSTNLTNSTVEQLLAR